MNEGSYYFCETIIHFDDLPGDAIERPLSRHGFDMIKVKGPVGGYSFIHRGEETNDVEVDKVKNIEVCQMTNTFLIQTSGTFYSGK